MLILCSQAGAKVDELGGVARKLRIQFEGAIYHVINRGNYRQDVFGSVGAAMAFETTLAEACELFEWRLHAYAIMRNHFHLALETPRANLAEGMHWLTGTYATRFNRLRSERGHLFQGRYQALLVEDTAALVRVVDYVHLNPVRAGVIVAEQLALFRWSSLRRFLSVVRPKWLPADWLDQLGLKDEVTGWKRYLEHLVELSGNAAEQERQQFGQMTRGWAIGTTGWRKAIAKDHAQMALASGVSDEALREIRAARFTEVLTQVLAEVGKDPDAIKCDAKSARWKIIAAQRLRERANAPHAWIAETLNMGSPASVRAYLCRNG